MFMIYESRNGFPSRGCTPDMRVVSLLPSATESLYALGVEPVGVSHSCDYPPPARELPVLTSTTIDHGSGQSAGEIDTQVTAHDGSVYDLDVDLLAELDPDVVVTQATCDVCAVDASETLAAVESAGVGADVVTLDPHSLSDVLADVRRIGDAVGAASAAEAVVAAAERRIDAVRRRVEGRERPRTAVLDWTDPPMLSGHWVPDVVRAAGGDPVPNGDGASKPVEWAELRASAPGALLVAPCGFGVDRAADAVRNDLATRRGWDELPAAADGRVFAFDGSGYVNRPGPRLVDTVELFAGCLHPDAGIDREPSAVRRLGSVTV